MPSYIEVYYRSKGTEKWEAARGFFYYEGWGDFRLEELLGDLARVNPHLEFQDSSFLLEEFKTEDIGRYELSDLFRDPGIREKYGFQDREGVGWKSLEECTIEIFVPRELPPVIVNNHDDPPF